MKLVYQYLLAGFILLSGTGYAQKGVNDEEKEVRVEVESADSGDTYHVKVITENGGTEKIYEKTYSSLEEMQSDSTISIEVSGDRQKIFNIQVDKLPGEFTWTSSSDSLGNQVIRTDGGNFVVIHSSEDEPGFHFSSVSDSVEIPQSYEIRIEKEMDSSGDEKEIKKEIWVLKDTGGNITVQPGDEHEQIIRIEKDHPAQYEVTDSPSKVKEASIQDISREDEDFKDFNIAGLPALRLKTLNYYPNPNAGEFTLTFSGPKKPVIIRILDQTGNLMYEDNLKNFTGNYNQVINVKRFRRGKYLLQIHQQGKVLNKKLILE